MGKPLSGHVALITGGRRGIGSAIAKRLSAEGADVVITAQYLDEDGIEQTLDSIRQAGGRAECIPVDLADGSARENVIAKAGEFFGAIDILVNNAAVMHRGPCSTLGLAERRTMLEVNYLAPIDLIQQSISTMRDKGWGRIVNIGSDTMYQMKPPLPEPAEYYNSMTAYGSVKSALARYTEGLASELAYTGIHINLIYPHKVCLTESVVEEASKLGQQESSVLSLRPEWAETVEMMAEAAYTLTTMELTGLVKSSREIVEMVQRPVHASDATTVIGNAHTLLKFD